MLTCSTCEHYFDAVDILGIDFVALEVLVIDASDCEFELKNNRISIVNMKMLKLLKIKCWRANRALIQMKNEQQALKHLETELYNGIFVSHKLLLQQCGLENSLKDLFISSYLPLPLKELVTLINRYKQVDAFLLVNCMHTSTIIVAVNITIVFTYIKFAVLVDNG
ncbi:hypothetical protein VCUG_01922 [Vavraia culicis subsp. floridensis]|uniref:Uncharacterized protein n=1 Tax=Vavraia culicis (isolate floridensis) TaxID=948595 RepID=L2GT90_VAVCU|nr:uncharacterized protein VCUG_01922 [Vavraia culicis subsp. floridensis]ELA46592.2 hypothetical protein VCUG_01922 [Vavraia culicis subsp. floridensis]